MGQQVVRMQGHLPLIHEPPVFPGHLPGPDGGFLHPIEAEGVKCSYQPGAVPPL